MKKLKVVSVRWTDKKKDKTYSTIFSNKRCVPAFIKKLEKQGFEPLVFDWSSTKKGLVIKRQKTKTEEKHE